VSRIPRPNHDSVGLSGAPKTPAVCTNLRKGSMYSLAREMVDWSGRKLNLPTGRNGKPLRMPYLN